MRFYGRTEEIALLRKALESKAEVFFEKHPEKRGLSRRFKVLSLNDM